MEHVNHNTISLIIKATIGVIFAVFFVILLSQYITMAQLNQKSSTLDKELESATAEYEELDKRYKEISENYEAYVEDYALENFEYGYEGDTLINKP